MEKRFVYADNAATTPLSEIAFNAMKPWLTEHYGNPSSLYRMGREAKEAIRNGVSPFEGPVRDVSGALRIAEGSVPDDATLRGMDWRVQGLEPLPLTPDGL